MLKAPFKYQGSKRTETENIDEYKPPEFKQINKIIDAFGGGGSVSLYFLQKYDKLQVIYNDLCPALSGVFETLKDKKETKKLVRELNEISPTQANYTRIREHYLTSPMSMIFSCNYAYMGCPANSKVRVSKVDGKYVTCPTRNFDYLLEYPAKLNDSRFKVKNKDALTLIERYSDDPAAFIYLDPPYQATDTRSYICQDLHELLPKILEYFANPETKCKILLHIDFNGETFSMFRDYAKCFYPVNYKVFGRKGRRSTARYLMIVTNY